MNFFFSFYDLYLFFFRYLSFALDVRGLSEVSLVSEHAMLKPARFLYTLGNEIYLFAF